MYCDIAPCGRSHGFFGPDSKSAPRSCALQICGRETGLRGPVCAHYLLIFKSHYYSDDYCCVN